MVQDEVKCLQMLRLSFFSISQTAESLPVSSSSSVRISSGFWVSNFVADSELTDMLAPDNTLPGYNEPSPAPADLNPKFSSRPIGAEKRTGPSPIGHKPVPDNNINHPFGVWDLPPSYTENNPVTNDNNLSFNLLPSSMTGQTLQPLFDNLSKTGTVFNDLQYNGAGAGSGYGLGGQIPASSLTPSKNSGPSFSDWGSAAGSAPPSGGKMSDANVGFRPDTAAQVRRNMVGGDN